MGLTGKARSTAGTVRAFPTLGRRMFFSEKRLDQIEQQHGQLSRELDGLRHAVADQSTMIAESTRRLAALAQQVEGLHATLTGADPQMTLEIVSTVRDEVARLTIELTEQMNRTSELLTSLRVAATAGDR
jgi:hypothetical protein